MLGGRKRAEGRRSVHKAIIIVIVNCQGERFLRCGDSGRGNRCSGNEDRGLYKQVLRGHMERAQDRRQRDLASSPGGALPGNLTLEPHGST